MKLKNYKDEGWSWTSACDEETFEESSLGVGFALGQNKKLVYVVIRDYGESDMDMEVAVPTELFRQLMVAGLNLTVEE